MLSKIKILPKLLIGFGLLILLIAGLSGFSVFSGVASRSLFETVARVKTAEVIEQRIEKRVNEARMHVWMALATGDQEQWNQSGASLQLAHGLVDRLIQNTVDPASIAMAKELGTLVGSYEAAARKERVLKGQNTALETPEAKEVVAAAGKVALGIDKLATEMTDAYEGAAMKADGEAKAEIAMAINTAIIVGSVSVLLGLTLATVMARSIASPIKAMTAAMARLAKREVAEEIVGLGRKDEIGAMAAAVQVFKDSMIRADQLAAEQEQMKAAAAAQQRATLNGMADNFEANVGQLVSVLSSSSSELEATAKSMSETADQTSHQAETVAAAAEEAGTGMQTVASAAEQLSSSISEISRQVSQSATITGKAVVDARRTDVIVRALSEGADKIGQVMGLIGDIAGQTNLLALNATIEAARAGDAGKGFAVVASEVKNLATQTAKATSEIGAQVCQMQASTKEAVAAIHDIAATINEVSEIAAGIAAAVEEQGAATAEIARNVQQTVQAANDVSANISGVNRAATDTGAAATQVLSAAGDLSQQSAQLASQVRNFVGSVRAA